LGAAQSAGADDAVLFDPSGALVSASMGNLFLEIGGRWQTPVLGMGARDGVVRAWVLERLSVEETLLDADSVQRATGAFVTNSRVGVRAVGEIDGLTDPAPSGGQAHPASGFDAVRAYRIHLAGAAIIAIRLTIDGTGRPEDHQDLDLDLRDIRGEPVADSRGVGAIEEVRPNLPGPAWYIIYVRDGGQGNRASYRLTIRSQ